MPARKASSKKKPSAKKRAVSAKRRPPARQAGASASRKKSAKKASSKKASPAKARSKSARSTGPARKPATSRKKPAQTSKKKPTAKKAARKPAAKKAAAKRSSTRKVSSKRMPAKASTSRKKTKAAAPSRKADTAPRKPARAPSGVLTGPIRGFEPYQTKRGEGYMNSAQLEHFRQILLAWKRELMEEVDRTMLHMKDDAANFPDPNDRATQESEFGLELRTRDRERKLLKKIDAALRRIDDGSYGYCEETGDEIGLRRLEARPVATLCVEAQERRELAERQFRDREDYYR